MKIKKSLRRLLAWLLVLTMVMLLGSDAWAVQPKQTEKELMAETSEESGTEIEVQEQTQTETETVPETQRETVLETEEPTETAETTETEHKESEEQGESESEKKDSGRKQPRSTEYLLEQWLTGTPEIWVAKVNASGVPTGEFIKVDPDQYIFTKGETIKIYLKYEVPDSVKPSLAEEDVLKYKLPNYFGTLKPITDGKIKDNDYTGGDAGKYTIDDQGNVEIKFFQAYLNAGEINGGDFSFEGTLNVILDENGESKLVFGDTEINIKVDTNSKLNVKKEGTRIITNIDGDSEIKYTITVTAPDSNPTNVTDGVVKDQFRSEAFDYIKNYSFEGYTKSGNVWEDGFGNEVTLNDTSKSFEWKLATLRPGDSRTLTYTVKVPKEVWLENQDRGEVVNNLVNDVIVEVNGKQVDDDKAGVLFRKSYANKSFSHLNDGNAVFVGLVNWGDPLFDMHGRTVTDKLTVGTFVDKVTVTRYLFDADGKAYRYDNWSDTIDVDGDTQFTYTFDKKEEAHCKYGYRFSYAVKYGEDDSIYNHINLDDKYWMDVENFKIGVKKDHIAYERDTDGKLWIDWKITATTVVRKGFWLRDSVMGSKGDNFWHNWESGFFQEIILSDQEHKSEAEEVYNLVEVYDAEGKRLVIRDDYEIELTTVYDNKENNKKKCQSMSVKFLKDFAAGVTVKVKTCINLDRLQEYLKTQGTTLNDGIEILNRGYLFANKETLVNDIASFKYYEEHSLDKDLADDFYDEENKTITWELTVNPNGAMQGIVNVLEELPEGLEYVDAEIIDGKLGSLYDGVINPKPTLTKNVESGTDKRTVDLTLDNIKRTDTPGQRDGQVVIKFVSKITDENFDLKVGTTIFTNKATIVNNFTEKENLRSVTKDAEIVHNSLAKAGVVDGSKVTYTIDVNKDRKQLIPTSPEPDMQELYIIDKWSENLSINRSTIKVYRIETDGVKTLLTLDRDYRLEIDISQSQFKMYIEDKTYYQIEYEATVSGAIGEQVVIKNDVAFFGKADYSGGEEKEFVIQKGAASSSSNPNITITKYIQGTSDTLEGAEFTLAPVVIENNSVKWEDQIDKVPAIGSSQVKPTDSSGKAVFSGLEWDILYVYWESKVPNGYAETSQTKYHYVYLTQNSLPAYITALQDAGEDVRINQESTNLEVENARILIITKKWTDVAGNVLVPDDSLIESVKVQLLQKAGSQTKPELAGKYLELTAQDNWTGIFTGLPIKDSDGNMIEYSVKEDGITYVSGTSDEKKLSFEVSVAEGTGTTGNYDFVVTNKIKGKLIVNKTDDGGTKLDGVKFQFQEAEEVSGEWKPKPGSTPIEMVTVDGKVTFTDLVAGKYLLTETGTISGMQLLKEPVQITIPYILGSGNATGAEGGLPGENGDTYYYHLTYNIKNNQLFEMPSAGGSGYPFYLLGVFCILTGGVFLQVRKRRKINKQKQN